MKSQIQNNQYTTPAITGNATLNVTFKKLIFTITVSTGTGGIVKDGISILANNSTVNVDAITIKTFTILPDAGYEVATLTYNGNDVRSQLTNNLYSTPSVTGNATLNVTFRKITYSITITTSSGGVIKDGSTILSNNSSVTTVPGTSKTFTILPDAGYEVATMTWGGTDVKNQLVNNLFTIPAVNSNVVLNVTFKQQTTNTFKLKVVYSVGGSVKENNGLLKSDTILIVTNGATKTISILPDLGFQVATVSYGGLFVTSQVINGVYTTPAITSDKVFAVTFEKIKYSLSIKNAVAGVVNLVCDYGSTPTFSFQSEDGWKINTILFNGTDITTLASGTEYTLSPIIKNSTLTVSYMELTASPVIEMSNVKVYTNHSDIVIEGISENEMVSVYTVNGSQIYNNRSEGERMVIPARPNAVYLVKTAGKTYKVLL